jgi:hypothetical protein
MHSVLRTILLAVLLFAGATPASNAQTTLRYQFKEKDKLDFVVDQKTKSTANLMGADIVSHMTAEINLSWEVLKIEQGSAQVRIKGSRSRMSLDSLVGVVEVDSNNKDAPRDAAGKMLAQMNRVFATMEITATMLPTGEMKDVKVSEATVKAMKAIPSADMFGDLAHPDNFKDLLGGLVLSAQPASKGMSWTLKTESQSPEGKISTEHVFTLEDTIDRGGVTLEKISLKPITKVVADPKAMIKVSSIRSQGVAFFDNKAGRLVESTIQQTKKGKIDVMGLTLDNTSEQTTTIRLKGQSAEEKAAAAAKIAALKIDESEFVEKVVFTEMLETIPGVARTFTVQRSYEPAITSTSAAPVSDELKTKVETALDVKLGKKDSVKESLTLDGKDITRLNVVWVERYRRVTATLADGSTATYLLRAGLRIKLEKPK